MFDSALEMHGGLDVRDGLAGQQRERGRRRFELVEGAERFGAGFGRAVVVGVNDVTRIRVFVVLPLRTDVGLPACIFGLIVPENGEDASHRVVAAENSLGPIRRDTNLGAVLAVALEEDRIVRDAQPVIFQRTKVVRIDGGFIARCQGDDNRHAWPVLEHAEHPHRNKSPLFGPRLSSGIEDDVTALIADQANRLGNRDLQ